MALKRVLGASTIALGLTLGCVEASAEGLAAALARAYISNPVLRAERARQRATDEQVPQALSGWRPVVIGAGDVGVERTEIDPGGTSTTEPAGVSIALSQPVFRGFRTVSGTRQAEAIVEAGQQDLLGVEQQVLLEGAIAYMDVWRDRQIVDLRARSVQFLIAERRATEARFDVGEVTRTDVSQARASVSEAQADLAEARFNLAASTATYLRVTGGPAGGVSLPKPWRHIPKTVAAALAIAGKTNPEVLAAFYIELAARHNVNLVKGELLPEVSVEASYTKRWEPSDTIDSVETGVLRGVVDVPIYESGIVYSRVREAKQVASQRRLEVISSERSVREQVTTAWSALESVRIAIRAIADQVAANQLALEGVKQEALAGSRTTLDVLDAERDLVDSQVDQAIRRRDEIVAAYQLIASMGRMTAQRLDLPVEIYDPELHYRSVRNKWIGTSVDKIK
jgi:TolC family type I secretion outer membrane protein